jgi:Mg/Co/Ni transporter MgtE
MNDTEIDLALAFLQSQPAAAAGILEQQPIDDVAKFFSQVPHTHAARVLAQMLPQYIARVCQRLAPTAAAGLLSQLDDNLVASVMRHSNLDLSRQLLDLLPEQTHIACRLLLNYAEDTVGAWMLVKVPMLPPECSVADALARIKAERDVVDVDRVPVVDRQRQLLGMISLAAMLRATPSQLVQTAMERNPENIRARTPLMTAVGDPLWSQLDTLAVTNRNNQLVGLLRHVDLRQGMAQVSTTISRPAGADPISGIFEVYGKSLIALVETVSTVARTKTPSPVR